MPLSDLRLDLVSWSRWRKRKRDFPLFLKLLKPSREDVILDVGAGTGIVASRLVAQCDEVFAVEPETNCVEYILRKYPEVKAFQGYAESIQFPHEYFTKVYTVMAFHHFGNPEQALAEFERILKPNGFLLIQEMNPKSSFAKIEKKASRHNFRSPESLKELVEAAGFESRTIEKSKHEYFLLSQKT